MEGKRRGFKVKRKSERDRVGVRVRERQAGKTDVNIESPSQGQQILDAINKQAPEARLYGGNRGVEINDPASFNRRNGLDKDDSCLLYPP